MVQAARGQAVGRAWLVPASSKGCCSVGREQGVSEKAGGLGILSGLEKHLHCPLANKTLKYFVHAEEYI